MTQGTYNEIELALLHTQRSAVMAGLLLTRTDPHLKAGAVQYLSALEDRLNLPRTFPPREERQRIREFARES